MSRKLFMAILKGVGNYNPYFRCWPDATGKLGLTSYKKILAAIHMLAYGVSGDFVVEYLWMSATTCLESMYRFGKSHHDTARLLSINEARRFPEMVGSINCMHWEWENWHFAWQGHYSGHENTCTIILEAISSHDLWIFFFETRQKLCLSLN
jgi:hypothetical protein